MIGNLAFHLIWVLVTFQSHIFITLGAAIPSPNSQPRAPGFSSTNLCDGYKINIALLDSFTPDKPPSMSLLSTCDQILQFKKDNPRTNALGVACSVYSQARVLDTYIALLHIWHGGDVYWWKFFSRCRIAYQWGDAKIEWCDTSYASKVSALMIYDIANALYQNCGFRGRERMSGYAEAWKWSGYYEVKIMRV